MEHFLQKSCAIFATFVHYKKLKELYKNDKEELKKYTKIIYAGARLIEGLAIDNPTEISNLTCEILAK